MSTQADQSPTLFKSLLTTPRRTHTPFGDGKVEKMLPFAVVELDFVGGNVLVLYFLEVLMKEGVVQLCAAYSVPRYRQVFEGLRAVTDVWGVFCFFLNTRKCVNE